MSMSEQPDARAPGAAGRQIAESARQRGASGRLPPWLGPRSIELPGSGRMRLIEATLLVLVGMALATATVYDVVRQSGINERLVADLRTWRSFTGHDYRELSLTQELLGARSQHEVVCGNTRPGAPKSSTQLCLAIWGPVRDGRRTVHGGWYLPPRVEDLRRERFGCFGAGSGGLCPR
jgi:hypothetical protein